MADQLVVCGFDEVGTPATSSLHVSDQGSMYYVNETSSPAVQWRGLDAGGGLTIYSGPIWEHQLHEIKAALTSRS